MEPGYSYVLFRGDKRRTVLKEDMYVEKIAMIFQISSSNLYITDDANTTIFADRETGSFPFMKLVHRGHYEVHGDPDQRTLPATSAIPTSTAGVPFAFMRRPSSAAVSTETPQASVGTPRARGKFPTKSSQRSICVAEVVNGKLFSARALNIRFVEADATIEGMTAKVMEALGSNEPVTLLDSKGNEILDSECSRSLGWWESKTRVIYAMPDDEFVEYQNGRRAKASRKSVDSSSTHDISGQIGQLKQAAEGLKDITSALNQLSDLAKIKSTAASLQDPMKEAFTCPLCEATMEVPMFATCCNSLVGCQTCVRQSLSTAGAKKCVKCEEEDFDSNVHQVKGLDDVLSVLRNIQTE